MSAESSAAELRGAWDDMIEALRRARDAIDVDGLHAPPKTERGLAEGYRYLLGFTYGAIERAFLEDPDFPYFRRAINPLDKATVDNADALYLSAAIDGDRSYRVTGRLPAPEAGSVDGAKPPRYMVFEAHNIYAGDSGGLGELGPGGRVITGVLDDSTLVVDETGCFEIVTGPRRPAGYDGNFIATRAESGDGSVTARYLILRILFQDWEHEVSPELHIVQIGKEGAHPAPLSPAEVAPKLRRIGQIVDNQMRFWNELYDVVLEVNGDKNGDGVTYLPCNDINPPSLPDLATGGGQSTNVYAGGRFELDPDQAMLIEVRIPKPPLYSGFHLGNLWGESLDYANRVTSLSGSQVEPSDDGLIPYVVAHDDPGVPNWVDTTGLDKGFMTFRWSYPKTPDELPSSTAKVLPFKEVRQHLPESMREVSPQERKDQIRIRQDHVQRRYRQY